MYAIRSYYGQHGVVDVQHLERQLHAFEGETQRIAKVLLRAGRQPARQGGYKASEECLRGCRCGKGLQRESEEVMFFTADGLSDCGRVREHNEDAFRIASKQGLFAIADGMGGHAASYNFV